MDPMKQMDANRGKTREQLEKEVAEGKGEGMLSRFLFDKTGRAKAAAAELSGRDSAEAAKARAAKEAADREAAKAQITFKKGGRVRATGYRGYGAARKV